jgi:hypothetical protein
VGSEGGLGNRTLHGTMVGGFETVVAKVPMEVGECREEMLATLAAKMGPPCS